MLDFNTKLSEWGFFFLVLLSFTPQEFISWVLLLSTHGPFPACTYLFLKLSGTQKSYEPETNGAEGGLFIEK